MVVFNFTGLDRWYFVPAFERQSDLKGAWYATIRWVGVEVVLCSRAMAAEFIERLDVKGGA